MATITKRTNKDGSTAYTIRVHRGRATDGTQLKAFTTTWKPAPNMSASKEQKELNKFVTLFEENCKSGLISTEKKSFDEYARYVIDLKAKNGLKHKTVVLYTSFLNRINDVNLKGFGYMKLTQIRADILNAFYIALSANGVNKKTGTGLSAKSINEYHRFISSVFSQAVVDGVVHYNPAERAITPKIPRKEAEAFSIGEVQKIIKVLEDEPTKWQVVAHLLIGTGARRGEILGLRWSDIDFKNNTLHLCNNLLYTPDKGVYADTLKTDASHYITVSNEIMALLRKHRTEQTTAMLQLGSKCEYSGYVITQWNGKPMHPDSVTTYFRKLSKKHNVHINPHKFRHTQASILINEGVDIVTVSKRLGHAKVSTTTDFYAHLMNKADEAASRTVSQVIYKTV